MQAQKEHGNARSAIETLQTNRRRDQELRAEIDRLNDEFEVFSELAELLKEHGAIQRQVAQQEQRRVALDANHILQLLNDPLRIRIDQARRGGDQDVTIVDISDIAGGAGEAPIGSQRYFEFLSGGEQFRIALALALALHRRLGGGKPGTVIVDEGFGALDGDRRDALALQMTDTSHGILGLGLARNLIICSHAAEVQRHFPNRWMVEKRSGTAAVRREDGASI
jgi:DNA repair exonuclease SbcCD ATPase subunit